jgi:hypothetical protein
MSINPDNITTIRVDQLAESTLNLTNDFPHSEGATLKKATIQSLVDLVATAVGSGSGVGFLPISVTDGQQLPNVPADPSFFLCGPGTYLNINGYPNVVCTEELNAIMSVSDHWEIAVEIPINVDLQTIGISQSVNDGVLDKAPSENAVYNFISQWLPKASLGYFDYADLATQTTPITVASGVQTLLTNDTLGDGTDVTQPPYGVTSVWDAGTNSFDFSQLTVGDSIDVNIGIELSGISFSDNVRIFFIVAQGSASESERTVFFQDLSASYSSNGNVSFTTTLAIENEDFINYPTQIFIENQSGFNVKVNGWLVRIFRKNVNIVSVDEAPIDGLTYGRKDAEWVEVSGGGSVGTLQQVTDNGNTTTNDIKVSKLYLKDSASELNGRLYLDSNNWFFEDSDGVVRFIATEGSIFLKNRTSEKEAVINTNLLTANRTYEYPDTSGTIALTSEIPTVDDTPTDGSSNAVSSNGVFDGLANKQNTLTETNFGSFINELTAKNTLVDADEVVSDDSADSNKAKKTSWLNVWLNYLKPKADALYAPIASVSTMVKLPANVTSTITTETVVSSFTYAVSANTTYIIRGRLALGCNGAGGVNLGTKFPSEAVINGNALGRRTSSSDFGSAGFATSGVLGGTLNNVNSQGGFAFVEIVLSVGATAGNFELIFASVTAGQTSTVIAAGSYLEYIKL